MNPQSLALSRELVARFPMLASQTATLRRAVSVLVDCHARNSLILTCGNGGSASDAGHIAAELLKGFRLPRQPAMAQRQALARQFNDPLLADRFQQGLRAVSLPDAAAIVTAIANDLAPELVFAQQVLALGRPGDALVGLSTSGNAPTVVHACQTARALGIHTIGFTGASACGMDACCDLLFKVPETETYKVQELHLPLYHALCAMVETECFA